MNQKEMEQYIIQKYQEDEKIMVLLFIQWCQEQNLDPEKLYKEAYPTQPANSLLKQLIEDQVSTDLEIDAGTLINVMQVFGNDDLAHVISVYAEK
ncbi:hypothetical protein [Jeotgalibacillus sp. R-1-5s-1]|uniref:hypothetical protein n=1 Tax=Jeotgalibacillus sp. R-1-5s-1 TaxID=2555897 RepID=UPI00106BABE3|nr:hypothetical protein [Jeotgalibacillus sp. R-1-5s-1]TFE00115.1 hypothetical protein E2491_06660 [Jeotgalibacillus sp. R-1-5s-1]